MTGFGVDVDTLDRVARNELPAAAEALRAPIAIVTDHAPTAWPVRDTLLADAEYFNPKRLEREFNDQVRAANLALDAEARANVRLVQAVLDPNVWHGTAADAFHEQMTHIETFMDQQSAQASMAAQAAGMTPPRESSRSRHRHPCRRSP